MAAPPLSGVSGGGFVPPPLLLRDLRLPGGYNEARAYNVGSKSREGHQPFRSGRIVFRYPQCGVSSGVHPRWGLLPPPSSPVPQPAPTCGDPRGPWWGAGHLNWFSTTHSLDLDPHNLRPLNAHKT